MFPPSELFSNTVLPARLYLKEVLGGVGIN
jgi:hypothetical protein